MIKLRKVGLTALAGSLAAVTAQAGDLNVTGGAIMTMTTGDAGTNSSQTLGIKHDVKFSASGDLDNGWSFSTHVLHTDASTVSSAATVITMGSMGSIGIGVGGGTNVNGGHDEPLPTAYEELSDMGYQSAANYVGSSMDGNALVYQAPSMDIMGATVSLGVEYSLQADGTDTTADGGGVATSNVWGDGYGIGTKVSYDALTLGAYYGTRDNKNDQNAHDVKDEWNGSWHAVYSMGPVSVGYQEFFVDSGLTGSETVTTNAKTLGTSNGQWEGDQMSIAFNVNDDLSLSYTESSETYDTRDGGAGSGTVADVTSDRSGVQLAYSMGAMSVKAYSMEVSKPNFDGDADDQKVNEIALGLAF
jgi:outer membrane protein OmpU